MKFKLFVVLVFIVSCFGANAQQHPLQFHSKNSFGISLGQHGQSLLLQTVNGVAIKDKWFAGAGFGIDYYDNQSYPLFGDIRRTFANNKAFVYFDLGANLKGNDKLKNVYYTNNSFKNGIYTDVGMGYQMKITKRFLLNFSGGFNYKNIFNKTSIVYECFVAPCPVDYINYKYGNGKVALKAGVDF